MKNKNHFCAHLVFVAVVAMISLAGQARTTYEDPPNACHQGCNSFMKELLSQFEKHGQSLRLRPTVYSGECRHLANSLDPDQIHHAVVMLDHLEPQSQIYFSAMFSYFAPENEFASWDLKIARNQMSPYWKEKGFLKNGSSPTSRVEIPDSSGEPIYRYFLRQDPTSGDLLSISYFGAAQIAFCRLKAQDSE